MLILSHDATKHATSHIQVQEAVLIEFSASVDDFCVLSSPDASQSLRREIRRKASSVTGLNRNSSGNLTPTLPSGAYDTLKARWTFHTSYARHFMKAPSLSRDA